MPIARSSHQRLKPLYVMDYLLRGSAGEHPVTVSQIIAHPSAQDISAERKSIYNDIEALRAFGLDIVQAESVRRSGYCVASGPLSCRS